MGAVEESPETAFEDKEWDELGLSRKSVEALLCEVDEKLHLTNPTARRRARAGFPQLEPYGEGKAVLTLAVEPAAAPAGRDPSWTAFYVVQARRLTLLLRRSGGIPLLAPPLAARLSLRRRRRARPRRGSGKPLQ